MNIKYITSLIDLLKGKQGALLGGLLVVLLGGGLFINYQSNKIKEVEYKLAQAVSDTVKVETIITGEPIIITEYDFDTLIISHYDTSYTTKFIIRTDTVKIVQYITKRITDTGTIKFEDNTNEFISIKGWLDFPFGENMKLEYRAKKLRHFKNWQLFAGAGWRIDENHPYLKFDVLYKKVGVGFYAGKGFYGANFNWRLF